MEIRKLKSNDIVLVVELWFDISIQAHNFISPDYWKENKKAMAETYLPNAETYLAIFNDEIVGFVAMADNFLAALFVQTIMQGQGIGNNLLCYIKERRETIQLKVYKKNSNSIQFYKKQGFDILSDEIDNNTNEIEYLMEWKK